MEKNLTQHKLMQLLGSGVLNVQRFGYSHLLVLWIEAASIQEIGKILKNDTNLLLDWLENLSVFEMDQALILSYFLRSTQTQQRLVLRISCLLPEGEGLIHLPSVSELWPMSSSFENEIVEMFGIVFGGVEQVQGVKYWSGFPLRKSFVFPKEARF